MDIESVIEYSNLIFYKTCLHNEETLAKHFSFFADLFYWLLSTKLLKIRSYLAGPPQD